MHFGVHQQKQAQGLSKLVLSTSRARLAAFHCWSGSCTERDLDLNICPVLLWCIEVEEGNQIQHASYPLFKPMKLKCLVFLSAHWRFVQQGPTSSLFAEQTFISHIHAPPRKILWLLNRQKTTLRQLRPEFRGPTGILTVPSALDSPQAASSSNVAITVVVPTTICSGEESCLSLL